MPDRLEAGTRGIDVKGKRVYGPFKIGKRGNSLEITIPKDLISETEIEEGVKIGFDRDEVTEKIILKVLGGEEFYGPPAVRYSSGSYHITIPNGLVEAVGFEAGDDAHFERDKETGIICLKKGREASEA